MRNPQQVFDYLLKAYKDNVKKSAAPVIENILSVIPDSVERQDEPSIEVELLDIEEVIRYAAEKKVEYPAAVLTLLQIESGSMSEGFNILQVFSDKNSNLLHKGDACIGRRMFVRRLEDELLSEMKRTDSGTISIRMPSDEA